MLATRPHAQDQTSRAFARQAGVLRCLVEASEPSRHAGPLAGLSYLAKDLLAAAGRPPSCGLADAGGEAMKGDAAILRILDEAGAARLGYAEMTPLAFEPSGANAERGRPLNPWDPERICGGSSSGSAVAVAAGLVDFAIGSDTAGSVRIPAQCCGVSAWKPTPRRVPVEGAMALAPSLDVIGFLAREAAILQRIASLFCSPAPRPIGRIAIAADLIAQSAPDIARAVTGLAGRLEQSGIATVSQPLGPLLGDCDGPVLDLLQIESAATQGWRLEAGTLEPTLAARLRKGQAFAPGRADETRDRLAAIAGALDLFDGHDAILLPVMPIPTPAVAACEPGSPDFSARTLYALSAFTRFVNGLGLCAVALPCGLDDAGMPVAAQLVGPAGSDLALLSLAADIQRDSDWHRREPTALARLLEAGR